jgi:hypothetical protein
MNAIRLGMGLQVAALEAYDAGKTELFHGGVKYLVNTELDESIGDYWGTVDCKNCPTSELHVYLPKEKEDARASSPVMEDH